MDYYLFCHLQNSVNEKVPERLKMYIEQLFDEEDKFSGEQHYDVACKDSRKTV